MSRPYNTRSRDADKCASEAMDVESDEQESTDLDLSDEEYDKEKKPSLGLYPNLDELRFRGERASEPISSPKQTPPRRTPYTPESPPKPSSEPASVVWQVFLWVCMVAVALAIAFYIKQWIVGKAVAPDDWLIKLDELLAAEPYLQEADSRKIRTALRLAKDGSGPSPIILVSTSREAINPATELAAKIAEIAAYSFNAPHKMNELPIESTRFFVQFGPSSEQISVAFDHFITNAYAKYHVAVITDFEQLPVPGYLTRTIHTHTDREDSPLRDAVLILTMRVEPTPMITQYPGAARARLYDAWVTPNCKTTDPNCVTESNFQPYWSRISNVVAPVVVES